MHMKRRNFSSCLKPDFPSCAPGQLILKPLECLRLSCDVKLSGTESRSVQCYRTWLKVVHNYKLHWREAFTYEQICETYLFTLHSTSVHNDTLALHWHCQIWIDCQLLGRVTSVDICPVWCSYEADADTDLWCCWVMWLGCVSNR